MSKILPKHIQDMVHDIRWFEKEIVVEVPMESFGNNRSARSFGSTTVNRYKKVKTLQMKVNGDWFDVPTIKEEESNGE